jgi:hypothetical protein
MPLELIDNILAPIDNNKYIRGLLLVVLLVSSGYFVPHPIIPKSVVQVVHNYAIISFILTLLLAYLLTSDVNVAVVVAVVIFVLALITKKVEGFETVDYDKLDRFDRFNKEENNNVSEIQYKKPQDVQNIRTKEKIVEDSSKGVDFDFTDDSLRYLTYDQKKLNKFQQDVLNDQFTGNQVNSF